MCEEFQLLADDGMKSHVVPADDYIAEAEALEIIADPAKILRCDCWKEWRLVQRKGVTQSKEIYY